MRHSAPYKKETVAFTLVELLTTVAIITILVALLATQFKNIQQKGKILKSISNLKALSVGVQTFVAENGYYPNQSTENASSPALGAYGGNYWSWVVAPYLSPAVKGGWRQSSSGSLISASPVLMDPMLALNRHHSLGDYGVNPEIFKLGGTPLSPAMVTRPSATILLVAAEEYPKVPSQGTWYIDASYYKNASPSGAMRPSDRGTGSVPTLFADGHIEQIPKTTLERDRLSYFLLNP